MGAQELNTGAQEHSKPDQVDSFSQLHYDKQLAATKSVDLSGDGEQLGSAHTPEHQNGSEHSSNWDQVPIGRTLEVDVINCLVLEHVYELN